MYSVPSLTSVTGTLPHTSIIDLKGLPIMKRLILTAVILSSLTACNKNLSGNPQNPQPMLPTWIWLTSNHKATPQKKLTGLWMQPQNKRLRLLQLPMTNMIQTVFIRDQTILPFHPQLKRRLLPGETVEVQFRPEGFVPIYKIIASTGLAGTHLRIVAETNNDVIDAVKINQGDCKIAGVEPYTVKFPQRVHYGMVFDLALENCTATQINNVTLSTVQGQLSHRPMEE
jgi:hypothetical protein